MLFSRKMPLSVESMDACMSLLGANDQHLAVLEQECGVTIALRGSELHISGDEASVELAQCVIEKLLSLLRQGEAIDRSRVRYAVALAREGKVDRIDEILKSVVAITHRGKQIRCKTLGQQQYVQAIREHDLTFAVGPAGTGKTYLAMALAVVALKNKEVERRTGTFTGIYWCVITAAYLGVSFVTSQWDRTWIIWPVAGVLFAALRAIAYSVIKNKK